MFPSFDSASPALELVLMVMLAATIFHSLRLERALGVLRRDRASLEKLVSGFNDSTEQAEAGIRRLQSAADGVGRQIARQIDQATELKSDLDFLVLRGGQIADRLEIAVRQPRTPEPVATSKPVRVLASAPPLNSTYGLVSSDPDTRPRSQAERELLLALRATR